MTFDVAASAYDRFMGAFSEPLADQLLALVKPAPGMRALDVGCGPGAVLVRLADILGGSQVAGVDPSEPFVAAARQRVPDADIRVAGADPLPFDDGAFDLAIAQLVVNFMPDPVAGVREMARVTRPGGTVAASLWDFIGERAPLSLFWRAARDVDPGVVDESGTPSAPPAYLGQLFTAAGLADPRLTELTVTRHYASFDEWWEPYTLGVGPAGAYLAGLDAAAAATLRAHAATLLPNGPFEVDAVSRVVTARV